MKKEIGIKMSIPKLLTCPISLELFNDPVTLCTGQTYEKSCILKWFSAGNITCPVTMQKLDDLSLLPNHTLTHLINQFLLKNTNNNLNHNNNNHNNNLNHVNNNNNNNNNNVALCSLKDVLESKDSTLSMKLQAIDDLECENECLFEKGIFEILLGLIFGGFEMMELVEKSLGYLIKLMTFCCGKDLNLVLEELNFENFKILFENGSFLVKIRLCNFMQIVFTTSLQEHILANKIVNDTKLMQMLISSLNDDQQNAKATNSRTMAQGKVCMDRCGLPDISVLEQNAKVLEASINTIVSILSSSLYRENLIKEGVIKSLVKYIMEIDAKTPNFGSKATKALELALELESGKQVFLANEVENGVKALIKMVFRVSGDDYGSENAVNCLMILCSESILVRENAIYGGLLTQLLLLLQSQCNGRVKTRARLLLKLLRSMWVKDPKSCLV